MKRLGLATDLIGAVLYLLSDEAEYITGRGYYGERRVGAVAAPYR
jgi:hypothetical protein